MISQNCFEMSAAVYQRFHARWCWMSRLRRSFSKFHEKRNEKTLLAGFVSHFTLASKLDRAGLIHTISTDEDPIPLLLD
jgi:hypothetical protein